MTQLADIASRILANNLICEEYDISPKQMQIITSVFKTIEAGGNACNKTIQAYFNSNSTDSQCNDLTNDLVDKGILKRIRKPKQGINFKYVSYYYAFGPKAIDFDTRYKQILDDIVNPPLNNSLLGL